LSEDDPLAQLEARLFRKIFFLVLAGALGIGGVAGLRDVRPDPFTGNDAKLMRHEILAECEDYVDSYYRPPIPTRIRIKALEDRLIEHHPDYYPPTKEWQ
jgi:hypothetical protein